MVLNWRDAEEEKYQTLILQLRTQIQLELSTQTPTSQELKKLLFPFLKNEAPLTTYQKLYEDFMMNLRACCSNQSSLPDFYLVQQIIHAFYTKMDLNTFYVEFCARGRLLPESDSPSSLLSELNRLDSHWDALHKNRNRFLPIYKRALLSYKGGVSWECLDTAKLGNVVHVKFQSIKKENDEKVLFIRTATPTLGSDKHTKISSEFLAYLQFLKSQNRSHLYVNMQDRTAPSTSGFFPILKYFGINFEKPRTDALENLNLDSSLESTITVISLDKNSPFYYQRGVYGGEISYALFKEHLIEKIFSDRTSGFHLPQKLRENPQTHLQIHLILDTLYAKLFASEAFTSRNRRILLDIFYIFFIDWIASNHDSVNITCKDGIDRAGAAHALYFFLYIIDSTWQKIDSSQENILRLSSVLFSDALSLKKREIQFNRFLHFKEASLFILQKITAQPQNWTQMHSLLHFKCMANNL